MEDEIREAMTEDRRCAVDEALANFVEDRCDNFDSFHDDDGDGDDEFDPRLYLALTIDESDGENKPIIEASEDDDAQDDSEDEAATSSSNTDTDYFISKNGTKWNKKPPPNSRIRAHNVVDYSGKRPGPLIAMHDPLTIFKSIFKEEIANIILRETNRKGAEFIEVWNNAHPANQKQWTPFTMDEMDAFLAIILHAGLCQSNNEPAKELWGDTHAPIYKSVMSCNRFILMMKFLRFDNANTRTERLLTSKTAAIDDIWMMMQTNLESAYIPHDALRVDEQLFPYKGPTRFTQYIPSKPAKYGIKIWWICDSKSFYPLKGTIYTGKLLDAERQANQGQSVVQELAKNYLYTGRTIYADNFFSYLDLAITLLRQKTAYVGTVSAGKPYVPTEFFKNPKRKVCSSLFGFYENDVALCSYVPRKNKSVILMSTTHYTCTVDATNAQKKPMAVIDYNNNKSGVDTMDQMLGTYTCKRPTNRWPLALFFNMVDVAAFASFVIYNEQDPVQKTDKRRAFLHLLIRQLAIKNIENRATNTRITCFPSIRNAMMAFGVVVTNVPLIEGNAPQFAQRSNRPSCYLCRQQNNRQRKTRAFCCNCTKAVCIEHSEQLHRCNTCVLALRIERQQ